MIMQRPFIANFQYIYIQLVYPDIYTCDIEEGKIKSKTSVKRDHLFAIYS